MKVTFTETMAGTLVRDGGARAPMLFTVTAEAPGGIGALVDCASPTWGRLDASAASGPPLPSSATSASSSRAASPTANSATSLECVTSTGGLKTWPFVMLVIVTS